MVAYYKVKIEQDDIIACQWIDNAREMYNFLGGDPNKYMDSFNENFYIDHSKIDKGLIIKTNMGDVPVKIGDYVIKHTFNYRTHYSVMFKDDFESYYEYSNTYFSK